MSRSLSNSSSLESLRGEAKRWLKALNAEDPRALARFRALYPDHAGIAKLRQVQHALAREYGLASWAALKQEIEDRARSSAERVRLFLEKSVNRYGTDPATQKWGSYEPDRPSRGALAARLLARNPEIARDSIHTAVAAHDLNAVRSFLLRNPALAHDRHPFDGWTPLLRLAYARLPIESASTNALPIAALLLDAGADPNAGWSDATNEFTVLVGVIGGGEGSQSAHPVAEAAASTPIRVSLSSSTPCWGDARMGWSFWSATAQSGPSFPTTRDSSWPLCVATSRTCGNLPRGTRSSSGSLKQCSPSSA